MAKLNKLMDLAQKLLNQPKTKVVECKDGRSYVAIHFECSCNLMGNELFDVLTFFRSIGYKVHIHLPCRAVKDEDSSYIVEPMTEAEAREGEYIRHDRCNTLPTVTGLGPIWVIDPMKPAIPLPPANS